MHAACLIAARGRASAGAMAPPAQPLHQGGFMKSLLRVLVALLALGIGAVRASDDLVYVPSEQSARLFDGANEKAAFWPLMSAFVSERNQAFCGIASAVMTLNVLRVTPPLSPEWYPYAYWDEHNVFTRAVLEVKPVLASRRKV